MNTFVGSTNRRMKRVFLWCAVAALLALGLMFYPYHPNTMRQNDSAAIGKLRQLSANQATFAKQNRNGFACSIAEVSGADEYSGYRFLLQCDKDASGYVRGYQVVARPIEASKTGMRTYCVTEQQMIWFDERGSATDCLLKHRVVSR
jgi:hypothetical protein